MGNAGRNGGRCGRHGTWLPDDREVPVAKALSAELGTTITPGFDALAFKASRGIEDIYELTYIRKDGTRFPAIVSVTALRDDHLSIIGYLLIGTDNSARKHAEEKLRWTEESFRLMVESVSDYAIVMLDPEGCVVSWNSGAQSIQGFQTDEIVGRHFSTFYTPDAAAHAHVRQLADHLPERSVFSTDECDIGLYARKILAVHNDWGSTFAHRQRYTAIELGVVFDSVRDERVPRAERELAQALREAMAIALRLDATWMYGFQLQGLPGQAFTQLANSINNGLPEWKAEGLPVARSNLAANSLSAPVRTASQPPARFNTSRATVPVVREPSSANGGRAAVDGTARASVRRPSSRAHLKL